MCSPVIWKCGHTEARILQHDAQIITQNYKKKLQEQFMLILNILFLYKKSLCK